MIPHRKINGPAIRQRGPALAPAILAAVAMVGGCASAPSPETIAKAREEAVLCVERGMGYPLDPAVRAQAMEAATRVLKEKSHRRIRDGLKDQHPGVRFAACMAVGKLKDASAIPAVTPLAADKDASVRAAAYFALEQMGDTSHRREWRDLIRKHENAEVRRNAVLAMGQLRNKETAPLLKAAAGTDPDEGVRAQALEALALQGDRESISRFIFEAFGGVGFKQPFALLTLGQVSDDRVRGVLRSRLANAPYLEARLAAARGLGMQGYGDGYDLALASLGWNQPKPSLPEDPPETQVMRVRSMAAMALGEIGDPRALEKLKRTMENPEDPRVQLAAATAILLILDRPNPSPGK